MPTLRTLLLSSAHADIGRESRSTLLHAMRSTNEHMKAIFFFLQKEVTN